MFTKGPWHKQELKNGIGIMLGEPPSPEKRYIPIVLAVIPGEIGGYEEERQANADVIAAAPDLYEALKHLVEYIDKEGPAAKEWKAITEWCEKGEQAILKAEGKS